MATETPRASFVRRSPAVMASLMRYLPPLDVEGSAAILGNLWAESRLQAVNEKNPTAAGSRGGYGWPQWTGSRRRAAEAFWAAHKMDPASDAAQLAFLIHELQTTHKRAMTAVMRPGTLEERAKAFELTYEVAGVKNYPARYLGARLALDAYNKNPLGSPQPAPAGDRQWAEDRLAVFEVRAIQQRLAALGFGHMLGTSGQAKDGVDGDWGPRTAGAIFAFQTAARITADGHYGPETQAALARGLAEPKAPSPTPTLIDDRDIKEGLTMIGKGILALVGPKTIVALLASAVAPFAAKYGISDASVAAAVGDLVQYASLLLAAAGSADASRKAVAAAE